MPAMPVPVMRMWHTGGMIGDTGAAIRQHRDGKMSQRELGEAIGHTSGSVVSKWERGEILPDVASISKVESALGVRPGAIMTVRQDEYDLRYAKAPTRGVLMRRELFRRAEGMSDAETLETLEWIDERFGTKRAEVR